MSLLLELGTGASLRRFSDGVSVVGVTPYLPRVVGYGLMEAGLGPVLEPRLTFPTYEVVVADNSLRSGLLGEDAVLKMGDGDADNYVTLLDGRVSRVEVLGTDEVRITLESKVADKSGTFVQSARTDLATIGEEIGTAAGITTDFALWKAEASADEDPNPDGQIAVSVPEPLGTLMAVAAWESFWAVYVGGDRVSALPYMGGSAPAGIPTVIKPQRGTWRSEEDESEIVTRLILYVGGRAREVDAPGSAQTDYGLREETFRLRFISVEDADGWASRFFAIFGRPQIYLYVDLAGVWQVGNQFLANFATSNPVQFQSEYVDGDRYVVVKSNPNPALGETSVVARRVEALGSVIPVVGVDIGPGAGGWGLAASLHGGGYGYTG